MKFILLSTFLGLIVCGIARSHPFPDDNELGWGNAEGQVSEENFSEDEYFVGEQWNRDPAADSKEEWPAPESQQTEDQFRAREMGYNSEQAWDASERRQNQFGMEGRERVAQQLAHGQLQESWGFADVNKENDVPSMLGREKEVGFLQDFELAADKAEDKATALEDSLWSSDEANQNDFREDNTNPTSDTDEQEFSPHDIVIQFFNSPGDDDDAAVQELDWNDRDFLKEEYQRGLIQESWGNEQISWDELMEQTHERDKIQQEPGEQNSPDPGLNTLPVEMSFEREQGEDNVNKQREGGRFRYNNIEKQTWPEEDELNEVFQQSKWEPVRFIGDDVDKQGMEQEMEQRLDYELNEQGMLPDKNDFRSDDVANGQGGWAKVGFMSMDEQGTQQEDDEVNKQELWQQENGPTEQSEVLNEQDVWRQRRGRSDNVVDEQAMWENGNEFSEDNVNKQRAWQQMVNRFRENSLSEQRMWKQDNSFTQDDVNEQFEWPEVDNMGNERSQQQYVNKQELWGNGPSENDGVNEQWMWEQENGFDEDNVNQQAGWQQQGNGFMEDVDIQELWTDEGDGPRDDANDQELWPALNGNLQSQESDKEKERKRINRDMAEEDKRMEPLHAKLKELEAKQDREGNLTECSSICTACDAKLKCKSKNDGGECAECCNYEPSCKGRKETASAEIGKEIEKVREKLEKIEKRLLELSDELAKLDKDELN